MIAYYETHAEKAPTTSAPAQVLLSAFRRVVGGRPAQVLADRANPRLWRKLRQVEALPPPDRKQVL
jgi:hypothetical protein